MFAVVFFYGDKSIDVVNKKKVKTVLENKSPEVGLDVNVKYQVHDIDESGRDVKKEEDFKGLLVHWEKDKKKALSFVDKHSEQIVAAFNQGKDELIAWSKTEENKKKPESGPRKRKITAKMREMLEEHEVEAGVPAAETKAPSAADGVAETKKIQAREYFKKKKAKQMHDSAVKLDAPQTSSTSSSKGGTDETIIIAEQNNKSEGTDVVPILSNQRPSTPATLSNQHPSTPATLSNQRPSTPATLSNQRPSTPATLSNQRPSTPATLSNQQPSTPATLPNQRPSTPATLLNQRISTPATLSNQQPSTPATLPNQRPSTPATFSIQGPSTSTINLNPEQNFLTMYQETPFTPPKKNTILPAHFSPIRRSPRLMEKNASRVETVNQRSGIQPFLAIHSTPEKSRQNLHFGAVTSYPPLENQLHVPAIGPYERYTEMNTADILGQGLYTLNNAVCTSEACRERIYRLERETEDLKTQLETMRSRQDQSLPVLIQEIRGVLDRWQQPNYDGEIFQPSRMDYDLSHPRPSNMDTPQNMSTVSSLKELEGT